MWIFLNTRFDRVWLRDLIYKLERYGTNGQLREWIWNNVTNRTQRVFINGSLSNNGGITAGMPQGSVLEPFLFLVYVTGHQMTKVIEFNLSKPLQTIIRNCQRHA